jgi:hypothetical protein
MTNGSDPGNDVALALGANAVMLPERLANWWAARFVEAFVRDPSARWWWSALSVDAMVISYEMDGLGLIAEIVEDWGPCLLFITDEEPSVSGVALGFGREFASVLAQVRFFEFAISDVTMTRFLFDTHQNEILVWDPARQRPVQ